MTFHLTRHTLATIMAAKGVSKLMIKYMGGWTTDAMPNRYIHLNGQHTREAARVFFDLPEFAGAEPVVPEAVPDDDSSLLDELEGLSAAELREVVELVRRRRGSAV